MCLCACLFACMNICVRHCVCTCIWVPDSESVCMFVFICMPVLCVCAHFCVCELCVCQSFNQCFSLYVCLIFLHCNLRDFELSFAIGRHRSAVLLWLPTLRNNDMAGGRAILWDRGHNSITVLFSFCLTSAPNFAAAGDLIADPVGQAGHFCFKVTPFNRHAVCILLKILDFKIDIKALEVSSGFGRLVPWKRTGSFIYLLCGGIEEPVLHND
jgi:hypothetical protein